MDLVLLLIPHEITAIDLIVILVSPWLFSFTSTKLGLGDPSSIPQLGRSSGEGIGYPLQSSWASLVAQVVKSPPEKWETWVRSLGWEDPLEKGKATHSSILAWRIPSTI